jgi:phage-related minor tail protein
MSEVAKLVAVLEANADKWTRGFGEAEGAVASFGAKMQSAGKTLTKFVTLPLLALGAAGLTASLQVDDALDTIRKGTGATGVVLQSLGEDFKAVGNTVPSSLADASTAIADLNARTGQSGIGLEELSTQVLTLARLSGSELKPLIADTTRVFGDWGITTAGQSAALDFLWKTSQATGVGVGALAQQVVQFGAPLRQLGFSFQQSAALMGKFEKEGVNAELVLGSLRVGLSHFAKAGADAPAALQAIIQKIQQLGPSAEATKLAIATFGARAGPDMATAIEEGRLAIGDLVAQLTTSRETIASAAGDTDDLAEQMQVLRNKTTFAFEALARPILPVLTRWAQDAVDAIGKLAGWFDELSPTTRSWMLALGAVAASIGPLIIVVGSLTRALLTLRTAFITLELSAGPVGWVLAVVAALGLLAAAFFTSGEKARDAAEKAKQAIDEYKAALAGLADGEVQTRLLSELSTVAAISGQVDSIKAILAGQEAFLDRAGQMGGNAAEVRKVYEALEHNRQSLTVLNRLLDEHAGKFRAASDEMQRRNQLAAQMAAHVPTAGALPTTDETDKLRSNREQLQALVRERALLARFSGARQLGDLPDDVQALVRDFESLTERAAQSRENINKLGAAAPAGSHAALAQLQDDLKRTDLQIAMMAKRWNRTGNLADVNFTVPKVAPFQNTFSLDQSVRHELGLPDGSTGGRLLGDLGEHASLASKALTVLDEAALQVGRALGQIFVQAAGRAGEFTSNLVSTTQNLMQSGKSLAAAGPEALAMAAAMEVAGSMFSALQPVMDALTVPLKIFGEILALLIVPVLKLLFPIFKVVAIVGSFLAETIARIVALMLNAIGTFVRALGKVINAIVPFGNPGNPLVKAGDAMKKTAGEFNDSADEMGKKRKELEHLSFDDAMAKTTDGMNRLTASVLNAVDGFKVEGYRFSATGGAAAPGGTSALRSTPVPPRYDSAAVPVPQQSVSYPGAKTEINITTGGDGRETLRELIRAVKQLARSNPAMAPWAATLPDMV